MNIASIPVAKLMQARPALSWWLNAPKIVAFLCCASFVALPAATGQAQILSTWTFNNVSNVPNGATNGGSSYADVASFSSTAATYGEAYNAGNTGGNTSASTLSSNTAGVFHGANIYVDFTPFYITYSGDANGGYAHDDAFGAGFDAGTGMSVANPSGGSGGSGSLFLSNGVGTNLNINLQSTGYSHLTLSFQVASIAPDQGNTAFNGDDLIQPEYSLDGGNTFTNIGGALLISGAFANQGLESIALPSALNNQNAFIVRLNLTYMDANDNSAKNILEIDNLSLSVPEPSMWVTMLGGLGLFCLATRRRRRAKA